MAYENYTFVSWSDGTPITGDRLQQMSLNMEQIRDNNDNKPDGLIQLISSTSATVLANVVANNNSIIQLTNPNDGADQRITIAASRYYRVTCHFPGFQIDGKGAEDSSLQLKIYDVATGFDAASPIMQYNFSPGPHILHDTAADANVAANAAIFTSDSRYVGAGTYSVVASSGGGINLRSFSVVVKREFGGSGSSNAPTISVTASAARKLQLYVEDIGGGN